MINLVDYTGNKVDEKILSEELAAPTVSGVRQVFFPSISDLTPTKLACILRSVDQGDINDYLTLAEQMEESDLHYHSVLSTRKLAVEGLKINVESITDDSKDVEQTDFVREVLESEPITNLIAELMDAVGKGFAVDEIIWDRSGKLWEPKAFKRRDQRFFQFDLTTMEILRLRDDADMVNGIDLAPFKFIVHKPRIKTGIPIRGGLARLAVIAYMCKSYALKDWLAFAEVFGMPVRVGKYPSGTSKAEQAILLRAVSNIGTDAACIISEEMSVEFISSNTTGGDMVFRGLADWLDSQVSKGVLGQTMTADAHASGIGSGQADVHNEIRGDIRASDAKQIASTLRHDVVVPLIDLNFGPRRPREYPIVRIETDDPEDLESLSKSLPPFIDRGLPVEVSTILDKFGLPTPEAGAQLLVGGTIKGAASEAGAPNAAGQPLPPTETPIETDAAKAMLRISNDVIGKLKKAMASAAEVSVDEIDKMVEESLGGWQTLMQPMLDPIVKLASEASNEKEFKRKLKTVFGDASNDAMVQTIATLTFQARALGDAKDRP